MMNGRSILLAALVTLSLLVVPTGAATAQSCSLDAAELDPLVSTYNANLDQVPGVVTGQLADQQIDVRIDAADGERRFAVTTDADGRITSFEEATATDPSLRVETSESAICGIVSSDDPVAAFSDTYGSGEIDVSGVGVVNSVMVGAVKVAAGVAKWLSGLF